MRQDFNIHGKHIRLNILVQTENVVSHSIMTDKQDLQFIIKQGVDYLTGLVKQYEKVHEEELEKVGK